MQLFCGHYLLNSRLDPFKAFLKQFRKQKNSYGGIEVTSDIFDRIVACSRKYFGSQSQGHAWSAPSQHANSYRLSEGPTGRRLCPAVQGCRASGLEYIDRYNTLFYILHTYQRNYYIIKSFERFLLVTSFLILIITF